MVRKIDELHPKLVLNAPSRARSHCIDVSVAVNFPSRLTSYILAMVLLYSSGCRMESTGDTVELRVGMAKREVKIRVGSPHKRTTWPRWVEIKNGDVSQFYSPQYNVKYVHVLKPNGTIVDKLVAVERGRELEEYEDPDQQVWLWYSQEERGSWKEYPEPYTMEAYLGNKWEFRYETTSTGRIKEYSVYFDGDSVVRLNETIGVLSPSGEFYEILGTHEDWIVAAPPYK